jgi:hypothetical protein
MKKENICWICGIECYHLQAAHIFAVEKNEQTALHENYSKFGPQVIPLSVNDGANGLLLCPNCHVNFDSKKREIKIHGDGKIIIEKLLRKIPPYNKLHGEYVWWKEFIGTNNFPSGKLLQLHFALEKRPKNIFMSDLSESEYDDEESEEEQPIKKRKRGNIEKHVRYYEIAAISILCTYFQCRFQ